MSHSATPAAADPAVPSTPRLSPARPSFNLSNVAPLPIPTSAYTTFSRFQPRCGHLNMIRLYDLDARCDRCNRHASFGWLYRCSEHRERIIDDRKRLGFTTAFDSIGEHFAAQMSLGKRGPDKRQDKYSLFHEMTEEQLHTYTPEQLVTLLRQRENVWTTAEQEVRSQVNRGRAPWRFGPVPTPFFSDQSSFETLVAEEAQSVRPWVPTKAQECRFTVCHTCYRGAADKAWLSLDGIVNGDIPPTAATAYGFALMKRRPVCQANVVGRLGYRAVPLPRYHPARAPLIDLTRRPDTDDGHSPVVIECHANDKYDPFTDPDWTTTDDDEGSVYSDSDYSTSYPPAPPPSTARSADHRTLRRCTASWSTRDMLAWSLGTAPAAQDDEECPQVFHYENLPPGPAIGSIPLPPWLVDRSNDGLTMESAVQVAVHVPLPMQTQLEENILNENPPMQELAIDTQGSNSERPADLHFGSDAPHVAGGGVAVREEAEEAGLADLVTQV